MTSHSEESKLILTHERAVGWGRLHRNTLLVSRAQNAAWCQRKAVPAGQGSDRALMLPVGTYWAVSRSPQGPGTRCQTVFWRGESSPAAMLAE